MDIIVTTPKSEMTAAAQEAADCIAAGGGEYFRRFPWGRCPRVVPGDRVYYVEDGYIRGFALVTRVVDREGRQRCDTTGRWWPCGHYVFMDARSWRWIRPIPMRGFQGYRYADYGCSAGPSGNLCTDRERILLRSCRECIRLDGQNHKVEMVGGWLDPRPAKESSCI